MGLAKFRPVIDHVRLRPEQHDDEPFLRSLYASTREQELAQIEHWDDTQRSAFLRMQFDAQRVHYREHFPDARFDIIEYDGEPIGRLYLAVSEEGVNLMDIALQRERRGLGLGGTLTRAVQNFARALDCPLVLHVEESNRAKNLYERLGFEVIGEQTFYKKMRWVS